MGGVSSGLTCRGTGQADRGSVRHWGQSTESGDAVIGEKGPTAGKSVVPWNEAGFLRDGPGGNSRSGCEVWPRCRRRRPSLDACGRTRRGNGTRIRTAAVSNQSTDEDHRSGAGGVLLSAGPGPEPGGDLMTRFIMMDKTDEVGAGRPATWRSTFAHCTRRRTWPDLTSRRAPAAACPARPRCFDSLAGCWQHCPPATAQGPTLDSPLWPAVAGCPSPA